MKLLPFLLVLLVGHDVRAAGTAATVVDTGKGARLEHRVAGSIARFGSHTRALVDDAGKIRLERGLLLVSSDSKLFRRAAVSVGAGELNLTVHGTALVALMPKAALKITCLEGQVTVGAEGGRQTMGPGELMLAHQDGRAALARIELAPLTKTCALLGNDFTPLPRSVSIAKISERQTKMLQKGTEPSESLLAGHHSTHPSAQPQVQGAPNMVALSNAFADSRQMASAASSDVTYAGYSSSSGSLQVNAVVWHPIDFSEVVGQLTDTGSASTEQTGLRADPASGGSSSGSSSSSGGYGAGTYTGSYSSGSYSSGGTVSFGRP